MKIIVEVGHPAHVHQFKNMLRGLEKGGHKIKICATDKDVTLFLLDAFGFKYDVLGANKGSSMIAGKVPLLVKSEYRMFKIARRFKPDLFVSRGSPVSAHISRIFGKPHIAFTDTEHAWLTFLLSSPFTEVMCVPLSFKKSFGKKEVRYNGYHQLAYLHPNYFKPDPTVLGELGLSENDKFIIVRFVAWNASHDINLHGLTNKKELIEKLENYGKVFVTSESEISADLRKYKMTLSPEKLHSALYYASLYFGDGSTTAVESALLGTPTVHFEAFNSAAKKPADATRFGVLDELVNKYHLLYTFSDQDKAVNKALDILKDENYKKNLQDRREKLLKEKIDVTQFMINLVENYPESLQTHKSDI